MTLRYDETLRGQRLLTILAGAITSGSDSWNLDIRTGSQPASADDAATGTLLAALSALSFGSPSGGVIDKSGTWQDLAADAAGEMGWFRITDPGGGAGHRLDGSVGATSSGADLEFDDVTTEVGQGVIISGFQLTEPATSGQIKFSTGWRQARLNAAFKGVSPGTFASGALDIYTGAPPSSPDDAPTGTLLASIPLPASPFTVGAAVSAVKNGTWQDTSADNTGTMGYFRLRQAGDAGGSSTTALRVDGTITATGGGGALTFDDIGVVAGQIVTITLFTFSEPATN